jgi:hypothetical protein
VRETARTGARAIAAKLFSRGEPVRKSIMTLLSFLLALSLAAALSGCAGGDVSQAQKYARSGDAAVARLNSQIDAWQARASAAVAQTADPASAKAAFEDVKASMASIPGTVSSARAEYEKIKGLKGVSNYAKYAELRIEALDLVAELLGRADQLFNRLAAMASAGDLSGASSVQQSFSSDVQSVTEKISALDEQARKLASDRHL